MSNVPLRPLLSTTTVLVGLGLLLAPAVGAEPLKWKQAQQLQQQQQQQQPQQQQPQQPQQQAQQQGQQQPADLDKLWQMQRLQMRARIAGAAEQLRTACADELRNFCSTVTPGEGRLALCMQAHEDKISRQCELAMLETSQRIGNAVHKVQSFAQACWPDIQQHCSGTGGSIAQCMVENRNQLSPSCQAIVTAMVPPSDMRQSQTPQQGGPAPTMVGLPIYSADGMVLGQVSGLKRRSDGSLEAIEAELGTPLGLGSTSVLISPGELRWKGDGVELQMNADQVRMVLRSQKRQ
ncbi:MAG TPA: cysteine rich repeat-containing protein [Hyphomicrobiaceae bacterium]|nr:cysteine rich repeat-containing protein [Hyphomicrobiaceae bacterium]